MKAVILSAGRGSRLLEHTATSPKCLLKLGPHTLLGRQVHMLAAAGVKSISVVTGFSTAMVEEEAARLSRPDLPVRTIYNPFYGVADNMASCWIAREAMEGDFILLNGDTLIESAIVKTLIQSPAAPVTLTVDRKAAYDDDDMKVQVENGRLINVGKTLPKEIVWGESIGMMRFSAEGAAAFVAELEAAIRRDNGLRVFYLSVIAALAKTLHVTVAPITGLQWCEIDFPKDYDNALAVTAGWARRLAAG